MKKWKFAGVILLAISLLSGCSRVSGEPVSKTTTVFDTVITIQIYDKNSEDILDACIRKCQDYENRFSRTKEGSEIYQLNHAGGNALALSSDTVELINLGLKYSRLSEGKFDITIAPLSDLWDFKNNTGTIPDSAAIEEAVRHVGYQNVLVTGNTVQLTDPAAAIDLGGIAKGYIADQLKKYMQEEGIRHALINLGGNVLALGGKPDGSSFNIGIQKPFDELGSPITSVKTKDQSIVSSGIYQRYFKVNDTVYHHILDPGTGYPYTNHLLGVTIICDSSAEADALSTTCFAMGLSEGMAYVDSLDSVEAIFITDDYKLHYSSGF